MNQAHAPVMQKTTRPTGRWGPFVHLELLEISANGLIMAIPHSQRLKAKRSQRSKEDILPKLWSALQVPKNLHRVGLSVQQRRLSSSRRAMVCLLTSRYG